MQKKKKNAQEWNQKSREKVASPSISLLENHNDDEYRAPTKDHNPSDLRASVHVKKAELANAKFLCINVSSLILSGLVCNASAAGFLKRCRLLPSKL